MKHLKKENYYIVDSYRHRNYGHLPERLKPTKIFYNKKEMLD